MPATALLDAVFAATVDAHATPGLIKVIDAVHTTLCGDTSLAPAGAGQPDPETWGLLPEQQVEMASALAVVGRANQQRTGR